MKKQDLFAPLFRTIDKVFFGFEEINETENPPQSLASDNEDEFDVERSTN